MTTNYWSHTVSTHWHPPAGFFNQPADKLAHSLLRHSTDRTQAIRRLSFYINRAGRNLSASDRRRLEHAKHILERGEENPTPLVWGLIGLGLVGAGVATYVVVKAATSKASTPAATGLPMPGTLPATTTTTPAATPSGGGSGGGFNVLDPSTWFSPSTTQQVGQAAQQAGQINQDVANATGFNPEQAASDATGVDSNSLDPSSYL